MRYGFVIGVLLILACNRAPKQLPEKGDTIVLHSTDSPKADGTVVAANTLSDTVAKLINSDSTQGERMVAFAKTLIGKPYVYGCKAPATGFDCSGFINYVFDHFNIPVPRSSVDFTNAGTTIPLEQARPGDLILFTGTNPSIRTVGHIGMVVTNDNSGTTFIHASSGKEMAVTITPLNERYKVRFVKVVRIEK